MKNCQHCQTELQNQRAKNCPICSAILSEANKRGTYSFVIEAIEAAREDGMIGDAVQAIAKAAHDAGKSQRDSFMDNYRHQQKALAAQRRADRNRRAEDTISFLDEEQLADHAAANYQQGATAEAEIFG